MADDTQNAGGTPQEMGFNVTVQGKYIRLETWGQLNEDELEKPAEAALNLAKETGVKLLLDNIQRVDSSHISMSVQTKGVGILWRLRAFDKVAIVFQGKEMGWLFLSTLEAMHLNLNNKFKGFDNESDAIAWLEEE